MYQVQTQLLMTNVDYVDFVACTKKDMHVERIERDDERLDEIRQERKSLF